MCAVGGGALISASALTGPVGWAVGAGAGVAGYFACHAGADRMLGDSLGPDQLYALSNVLEPIQALPNRIAEEKNPFPNSTTDMDARTAYLAWEVRAAQAEVETAEANFSECALDTMANVLMERRPEEIAAREQAAAAGDTAEVGRLDERIAQSQSVIAEQPWFWERVAQEAPWEKVCLDEAQASQEQALAALADHIEAHGAVIGPEYLAHIVDRALTDVDEQQRTALGVDHLKTPEAMMTVAQSAAINGDMDAALAIAWLADRTRDANPSAPTPEMQGARIVADAHRLAPGMH